MRERQPQALGGPADVGVIEHHALRWPGGPRRVDDGGEVGRLHDLARGLDVDGIQPQHRLPAAHVIGRDAVGVLHEHDVLEGRELGANLEEPLEVADVLEDRDLGVAVAGEVLHLLGGGRVVDRDRGGADQQRGHVGDEELGPVAHHEHDPIAPSDAEVLEPGRDPARVLGVLGERALLPAVSVLRPQRHRVGPGPDGLEETAGDGLPPGLLGERLVRHLRHR